MKDGDGVLGPLWAQYPDHVAQRLEAAYLDRSLPQIVHWGPSYFVDVENMLQAVREWNSCCFESDDCEQTFTQVCSD